MLYFNAGRYEFWKLYETIRHFYPIGTGSSDWSFYKSYPGQQEFEQLLIEKLHDPQNFEKWEEFTAEIALHLQKKITGTTSGQFPSFSSVVQLEKTTKGNVTRIKELCFFVSILGPYYTVIGHDRNEVKFDDQSFNSTYYLVASPENEFADAFNYLCKKIEEQYNGYRFVPFGICKKTIEGLIVRFDEPDNSIFHALFNDQVDLNTSNVLGDEYYKSKDWEKEDYIDDGARWTAYPPAYIITGKNGQADVNGIRLYYEIHGTGNPLVLLHGGGSTIHSSFGRILSELSTHHQVIAVELQNHGRSGFRNIPQTFEQDADDVAALLNKLGINKAAILGFSNGGTTALQLAIRHPRIVTKLVVIAAAFKREGFINGFFEMMQQATIEDMPAALKDEFLKVTPDPARLQTMFERDRDRMIAFTDISETQMKTITSHVLIINGDSDVITTEHAIEMKRLLPTAQLAVLPGIHGECIGEITTVNENHPRSYPVLALINQFLHA